MSEPRPPAPPLNRVFRGGVELKPRRADDIRLVSNGETFGIQHRTRFLWWSWWSKPIHTGLTREVAQEHVRRVQVEIQELEAKRRERWYPVAYPPVPGPLTPPPAPPPPPPWMDSGRRKGQPR